MNGTAYRTLLLASPPNPENIEAVYAVWPPARYSAGETPYVLVSSSSAVGDTCIFPCDETGQMIAFEMITCSRTVHHAVALRLTGWDLEVPAICAGPCCAPRAEVANACG